MRLCDSNVWLALALSKHVHHIAAREWLETVDEPASVLFCRATQQTFLRLLTNASVLPQRADRRAPLPDPLTPLCQIPSKLFLIPAL